MLRMTCWECGATFDDGIDAGHHEMRTGHRTEWDDASALTRGAREMTYLTPDGETLERSGAYALPFAVLVRSGGTGEWGFYGTHRTLGAARKRLSEAYRRGGFDATNATIVEGEER